MNNDLNKIFHMLMILNSKKKFTRKQLATELNCSVRQVGRYKEKLSEFFTIESSDGVNGGYRLLDNNLPFKELLTRGEIDDLILNLESLVGLGEDDRSIIALKKIKECMSSKNIKTLPVVIPYSTIRTKTDEVLEIERVLNEAIKNSFEVLIDYEDNNGKFSEKRRIRPYKFILYKGEYYLGGYCTKRNDTRIFKIIRLKRCFSTSIKFIKEEYIEEKLDKEYQKDNIGIFSGESVKVKLLISTPIANTIKERNWTEEYKIEELGEGKIYFSANLKYSPELISWVGSMLNYVEIIEPECLKKDMRKIYEKCLRNLN